MQKEPDTYQIQLEPDKNPEKERTERLSTVLPTEKKTSKKFIIFLDVFVNIVIVVVLYFFIKEYLVAPFRVIGPSMCDSLNYIDEKCEYDAGEYLILNKAKYHNFFGRRFGAPERGDIVVFHPPQDHENFYIKRVIGLPGETVELKGGKIFINGGELLEPYLNEKNQGQTRPDNGGQTRFKIPLKGYFVLGDNRLESIDARSCFADSVIGDCSTGRPFYLTIDDIEGKAWVVLSPLKNMRFMNTPDYVLDIDDK